MGLSLQPAIKAKDKSNANLSLPENIILYYLHRVYLAECIPLSTDWKL